MISLLEPTQTTRYVYFDDSGMISSITGRLDENSTNSHALFEMDDIKDFIEGNKRFTDYAVTRTENPLVFEIVKKKANLRQRNVKNQIYKLQEAEEYDILVEVNNKEIKVSASADLVTRSGVRKNQNVSIAGTDVHPFFITFKDRPDFLIDTVLVSMSDLLCGETVSINYEHKYDISVYTKKYFDTYSLRRA